MSIGPRLRARSRTAVLAVSLVLAGVLVAAVATSAGQAKSGLQKFQPQFSNAAAFDVSPTLRDVAKNRGPVAAPKAPAIHNSRIDRLPAILTGSGRALATAKPAAARKTAAASALSPLLSFEGLSNQDNFNIYGGRVNPPDPNGEVGPNDYVEMINLAFAVYSKAGTLLLGPVPIGSLWSGFPVTDCAGASGDPVVLYDQKADRWLLSQFTSQGPNYWNCVAISQTGDPTGAYYRYAFSTGVNFPDYPKYSVWRDSYIITTREFGPTVEYGIGVYGLERNKMIEGDPNARVVSYFLDGNAPGMLPLVGDGLLPPDIDGFTQPMDPAPLVGTQDDGAGYGATFDAVNIWEFDVKWRSTPTSSIALKTQLPTAPFDSIFPCAPTSRDCLPQPGIVNPAQYLDILSYRQRPTFRLAYRNLPKYDAMVTNQSVEAAPGVAGVRWYEIHRDTKTDTYSIYQQGTYAPGDGVHRWMGSAAMDRKGDIALGYSVVNGTNVYPGIRYTGRLAGDPLGQMTLGEGTIINGSGVQTTTNSRWGDYTDLTVDPTDDCTFWYVNEYYTAAGQASSTAGWQTRIAAFRLPGC